MASLLRKYPGLALHLTDHTRTPILSSASAQDDNDASHCNGKYRDEHQDQSIQRPASRSQRAQALDHLADTALRARDTASRLGMGHAPTDAQGPWADSLMTPPECIMVSYNTGVVMVESFLNPRQPQKYNPRHNAGHGTRTGTSGPATKTANSPTGPSNCTGAVTEGSTDEGKGTSPLIMGLVVAPGPQALVEAQRALAQLERMGRAVQQELVGQEQNRG